MHALSSKECNDTSVEPCARSSDAETRDLIVVIASDLVARNILQPAHTQAAAQADTQ